MELWTCESCGSKNAGEACWRCSASRPAGATNPSTPAAPSTLEAEQAPSGSWDPQAVVPHKPVAPSWSEPIAASPDPPAASAPAPPAASAPAPPQAAAPPPPAPAPAPYSPPQGPAADSWSAPAGAAVPSPPPPPPPAASPIPTVRIVVAAAVVLILLVVVLIITLAHHSSQALTTPASVEGLPQIQGAAVNALAQQARQNVGPDGQDMLVGVYGRNQVPAFIFVVMHSRNELASFENGMLKGASQAGFSPGAFQHRSLGGVTYDCGSVLVTVGFPLSFCFFDDGNATGAGLVPAEPGIDRALQLTSSGRGAAENG